MPDNTDPKQVLESHVTQSRTTGWNGVTPPIAQVNFLTSHNWWRRNRTWHRQVRPYVSTMRYQSWVTRTWPVPFTQTGYYGPPPYGRKTFEIKGVLGVPYAYGADYTGLLNANDTEIAAKNAVLDMALGASWNSVVFAGELAKTRDFVFDFAKSVDKAYRSFRQFKRNPNRAFRTMSRAFSGITKGKVVPNYHTKDAASLWLQFRYAVMTGISDIKNMAKAVAEIQSDHKMAERVLRANRTAVYGKTQNFPSGTAPFSGCYVTDGNASYFGMVKSSAWLRVKPNFVHSITWEASKLGLLNPVVAMHELTFLSFVADWVLDLGNYLERLNALSGLTVVDAGVGTTRRGVVQFEPSLYRSGTDYIVTESGPVVIESTLYTRARWENPSPVWTPGINMSTNRWIDAAALLRVMAFRKV